MEHGDESSGLVESEPPGSRDDLSILRKMTFLRGFAWCSRNS
jgi:hypothetical protein